MKSYKECPHWISGGKLTSRRKALKFGATTCLDAVNARHCRRCPLVPESKLRKWKEENLVLRKK